MNDGRDCSIAVYSLSILRRFVKHTVGTVAAEPIALVPQHISSQISTAMFAGANGQYGFFDRLSSAAVVCSSCCTAEFSFASYYRSNFPAGITDRQGRWNKNRF